MAGPLKHLSNLDAVEVSFVPRGATRKRFLILKEEQNEMVFSLAALDEILRKTQLKDEAKIAAVLKEAGLEPDDSAALTAALRVLSSMGDKVSPQTVAELTALVGYPQENELEIEKAAPPSEEKPAEAELDPMPIMKSDGTLDAEKIPLPIRAQVVALWNAKRDDALKLSAVKKELDEKRDSEITRQYLEKAGELKFLPIAKEDLGSALKDVAVGAPKAYERIEAVLKSANELLSKSPAFEEHGSALRGKSNDADVSYSQIEQAAIAQPIAKSEGMSKDQAVTHFLTKTSEGRRMYSDYCKTKEKGV